MAANIGQIAQLLDATLDPAQHRTGNKHPTFPRCPAVLVNKQIYSRDCTQAGGYQASVLAQSSQHCQLRYSSS